MAVHDFSWAPLAIFPRKSCAMLPTMARGNRVPPSDLAQDGRCTRDLSFPASVCEKRACLVEPILLVASKAFVLLVSASHLSGKTGSPDASSPHVR